MQWETVIGLEIHVQLATRSKIFSGAATTFGAEPNTQACAVDLAMPGTLPVLNEQAVNFAVMFGLAVDSQRKGISRRAVAKHLEPNQRAAFKRSWGYVKKQPALSAAPTMAALG